MNQSFSGWNSLSSAPLNCMAADAVQCLSSIRSPGARVYGSDSLRHPGLQPFARLYYFPFSYWSCCDLYFLAATEARQDL